jgi:nitrite transporter NirC
MSKYNDSVNEAVQIGVGKGRFLRENPLGYFVASMMAGIYVGLGIILIFSVGAPFAKLDHPAVKLVMGASFGLALTLVVFAGSELFTGNAMYLTFSWLRRQASWADVARVWVVSWLGNLVGSLLLAWLAVYSGSIAHALPLIAKASVLKMNAPAGQLFGRGLLCNLLVCLALWTAGRTRSDAAKIVLICLCLFAFIGSGFEHSIANMTLLGMGLFAPAVEGVGWGGYWYNLFWVTLGNIAGGAVIMAGGYHLMAREKS